MATPSLSLPPPFLYKINETLFELYIMQGIVLERYETKLRSSDSVPTGHTTHLWTYKTSPLGIHFIDFMHRMHKNVNSLN
jgi:hypothetical protein